MAKDAPRRPRAETPKGFRDCFGAEVVERQAMLATIAEVYRMHGFEPLETSAVETVEALGKFLPDVDRPNEGVFAWQDEAASEGKGGDWLALRYDLTAPLARVAAQYRSELPSPYRRYAMGPVWRNEKPGPGRFRQFYQCDADTVGSSSVAADAELCTMLSDALEAVGIERGDYVVRINSRKVLDGALEIAGLGKDAFETERLVEIRGIVQRAIDKMDRLGWSGVKAILGDGRKDESGDFTKGAGLKPSAIDQIERILTSATDLRRKDEALEYAESSSLGRQMTEEDKVVAYNLYSVLHETVVGMDGLHQLIDMIGYCRAQGYGSDRIVIDPSVVRGLGYYTGPVFEAELTFTVTDEKGRPRQFGSVAGGGRYDDLVKRFTGQEMPATGVSIGVDRLLAALKAKRGAKVADPGPVIVTVMDRDRMADYMAMAADLRSGGIRAEVYLGNPKSFGNQLKYADKRGSPVAVIMGGDEAGRGTVILKDLILGAKIAAGASLEEWKARPAQVEVPRDGLVAAVRQMLAR
ncbi:MAG: histidine--tRNA ligase [Gemmobacter sp.]